MATLIGDVLVFKESNKKEIDSEHIINWVSDIAHTINKLTLYTESLEERIRKLENPDENLKLE